MADYDGPYEMPDGMDSPEYWEEAIGDAEELGSDEFYRPDEKDVGCDDFCALGEKPIGDDYSEWERPAPAIEGPTEDYDLTALEGLWDSGLDSDKGRRVLRHIRRAVRNPADLKAALEQAMQAEVLRPYAILLLAGWYKLAMAVFCAERSNLEGARRSLCELGMSAQGSMRPSAQAAALVGLSLVWEWRGDRDRAALARSKASEVGQSALHGDWPEVAAMTAQLFTDAWLRGQGGHGQQLT